MSLPKKTVLAVIGYWLLVSLAGCGYTTRSLITEKYKTIYITQFANKIDIAKESESANRYRLYQPMLELDITQALIERFLWDGNLRPQKEASADLILKGELVEFSRDPLRYTDNDEVEEYRITIRVNLSLWDNRGNKLIWEEKLFAGDTTYFTTGPAAKLQDSAISDAIKDLVRRIVERTVEEW